MTQCMNLRVQQEWDFVKGMTAEQISRGDVLCSEDLSSSHVKVVSPAAATASDTAALTIVSTEFMKNSSYK
jgi:hypothetical protein